MRATAKSQNAKRKTQRKLYNELLSDPCDTCGTREGTISYVYVTRSGNRSWKTHCVDHMQRRNNV